MNSLITHIRNFSITSSTLKTFAIIIMLIDHVGAAIIGPLRTALPESMAPYGPLLYEIYPIMRNIGRLAFPIFCFTLVEGFLHTRNAAKYALRLFIFALISELPFDYALSNRLPNQGHQNVYFTLLIGLLVMMGMSYFENRRARHIFDRCFYLIMQAAVAISGMYLAKLLCTDYRHKGVFLIVVLYILRCDKRLQTIFGALAISWEATAPLAFIPIWFYKGELGRKMKYFFYWFYPVHLVILGILRHAVLRL